MWPWNNIFYKLNSIENKIDVLDNAIKTLSDITKEISFKTDVPEALKVKINKQERVKIMGKLVNVFTYEVVGVAVPEKNDAVQQVVTAKGVYQDVENTAVDVEMTYDRADFTVSVKGVEGNVIELGLAYVDAKGNKTITPQTIVFEVEDKVAPEVPEGALAVTQLPVQEVVELPDEPVVEE